MFCTFLRQLKKITFVENTGCMLFGNQALAVVVRLLPKKSTLTVDMNTFGLLARMFFDLKVALSVKSNKG